MKTFNELIESLNNPYSAVLKKSGKQEYRATVKLLQGRERLYKRLLTKNLGRAYNISTDTSSSGTMFNMVRK